MALSEPMTQETLTRMSASDLARAIAAGQTTSRAATEAFIGRIQGVNPALNAVVVPLFDQALADADAADAAVARGGALGLLHGVPMTIKEQFPLRGTPVTLGLQSRAERRDDQDCLLVARLRAAGAIFLGKTNVPQLLIYNESDNPVYGLTNNPWNLSRSPGGSSGGEGAVIAAGGSPLGLASDIGGSIRGPAHACAIQGIKPTSGCLSLLDVPPGGFPTGQTAILAQAGPLARTVADLDLTMRVLAAPGQDIVDPDVPPMPWPDYSAVDLASLRVGYYEDDGFFPASPAVRRAVREGAEALRARGVTVIPFTPPRIQEAMTLFFSILGADGGASAKEILGHDKRDRRVAGLLQIAALPNAVRPAVAALLDLAGQRRLAALFRAVKTLPTEGFWQVNAGTMRYRAAFSAALDKAGIDALICPPLATPALTHGATYYLATAASYAMLYNLLGMPAGVVAATTVRTGEESDRRKSSDIVERTALKVERNSAGLPVGVQVAARHWREDIVLAVMSALEAHFTAQPDYPAQPPLLDKLTSR